MKDKVRRAWALRQAGQVQRCHTLRHVGEYSIAEHTYQALSLLLTFRPQSSPALIKALLWHDAPELWLGDLPAPAHWNLPPLSRVYKEAELFLYDRLGVHNELLDKEEHLWLRFCDSLEFWLWCEEQRRRGNNEAPIIQAHGRSFTHIEAMLDAASKDELDTKELRYIWDRMRESSYPLGLEELTNTPEER